MEVGIGPHVDHDVQDADFNETRLPSQKYNDQCTGLEHDLVEAAAARQSEIDFAWRLKAFEPRPRTEAYQRMGPKPFGMRWIDCNKGDGQRRELRSRLVVQETRQTSTISVSDIAAVTSSTPPLDVVRLFCTLMMSMKGAGGAPLVLQFRAGLTIRAKNVTCSPFSPQELISDYSYSRGGGAELFSNYSYSRGRCMELFSNSGAAWKDRK